MSKCLTTTAEYKWVISSVITSIDDCKNMSITNQLSTTVDEDYDIAVANHFQTHCSFFKETDRILSVLVQIMDCDGKVYKFIDKVFTD